MYALLEGEYDEVKWNVHPSYPKAFPKKKGFNKALEKAKVKKSKMKGVDNTDAPDVKKGQMKKAKKLFLQYKSDEHKSPKHAKKYFKRLKKAVKSGDAPPSIVGVHKKSGTKHLIAGNTRAMISRALGKKAPVQKVKLKGPKT